MLYLRGRFDIVSNRFLVAIGSISSPSLVALMTRYYKAWISLIDMR
jgi:hypothetical protein